MRFSRSFLGVSPSGPFSFYFITQWFIGVERSMRDRFWLAESPLFIFLVDLHVRWTERRIGTQKVFQLKVSTHFLSLCLSLSLSLSHTHTHTHTHTLSLSLSLSLSVTLTHRQTHTNTHLFLHILVSRNFWLVKNISGEVLFSSTSQLESRSKS